MLKPKIDCTTFIFAIMNQKPTFFPQTLGMLRSLDLFLNGSKYLQAKIDLGQSNSCYKPFVLSNGNPNGKTIINMF